MVPKCNQCCPRGLPSKYEFVGVLGRGSFGKVVKCIDKKNLQIVAIKMPTWWTTYTKNEIPILRKSMCHNLDKHNIVKYVECFQTIRGKALVFETLDMSLDAYMMLNKCAPMLLSDIRTIIQQMATAFDALKGIGVIHTDVKRDNIMMVNHFRRPFEVKLIDFGLAIPTSKAKNIRPRVEAYTAPEVFLGCEFNEAIDMWSLGCTMFDMICGCNLFVGHSHYETMLEIVEFLGKPADHLLEKCDRAKIFFTKTDRGVWRIKTPLEFFKRHRRLTKNRPGLKCLDELKAMRLEEDNKTEAVEREQCIELLKAMLAFDADERITPCEVLTHPFITKVYPNVQTLSEDFECEPPAAAVDDEDSSNIQPGDCTPSPEIRSGGAILVRPDSSAENTTLLEDKQSTVSEPTAAPLRGEKSSNIQPDDCTPSPEILPSGAILVRPVTAKNSTLLEDQQSTVSEPTAAPLRGEESSNIQPADCTPSPEILPSGPGSTPQFSRELNAAGRSGDSS
ncbi:homeodomain-interacting protein kinase 1 isoform X1 [Sparus aurata]|uniref:homeodomain-interacting protein kinase 1 isoform X1 n=1 Tax=Sparus aurata TaxID=8175 RepID=UPI0011C14666|nr:homeodomain-interacting protein kinase 1-like isoform X1 [Sparus aurata]